MAITFNTNLAALGAQRNIGIASNAASSSLSKLSSGSRVPQAKDDAAGLAIGSKLKSEVTGLTQASNNAAQAISLLQIADGALASIGDMLQRMKALAVQSSSGQLADSDRALLDQEYGSLVDEIDRVAALSNFNGTTLLAGSTTTSANVNDLVTDTAGQKWNGPASQIGEGFDAIEFNDSYGGGAIKVEYDATNDIMTVTDLVNDKKQSIAVASAAIAAGDTETYNFGDIGVKITLNDQFNKATNIISTNDTYVDVAVGNFDVTSAKTGTGVVTASSEAVTAYTFNGEGANLLTGADLGGVVVTFDLTDSAAATATATVGGLTFTSDAAIDLSDVGAETITLSDGNGNSFTVGLNPSTGFADADTLTMTIATTSIGAIDSGTNGKPQLIGATVGDGTAADLAFDFGSIDDATIDFSMATASSSTASITLNGHTFTSAAVDMSTTGVKTLVLTDTTANYTGNSLTVTLNVTSAFGNGDDLKVELGDLGQVVGANSVTSGSTTFDFKVGTGTTANDSISFSLTSATATTLGVGTTSINTAANANTAIAAVNSAITAVSSRRADIGAAQSRLDFASTSISVSIENTTAAQSALLDVDVSAEITTFTNKNVLMQAGISLLGQANQQPALLLRLLQ